MEKLTEEINFKHKIDMAELEDKIKRKIYTQLLEMKMKFQIGLGEFKDNSLMGKAIIELSKEVGQLKIGAQKRPCDRYRWITINPPPKIWDNQIERLLTIATRLISDMYKWKNTKSLYWTFEQRSRDFGTWNGVHIHMLIENAGTQDNYDQERQMRKKCKVLWGEMYDQIKNWNNVFKFVSIRDKYAPDKIEYLYGNKYNDEKAKLCEVDKEFRAHYGLKLNYYPPDAPLINQENLIKETVNTHIRFVD